MAKEKVSSVEATARELRRIVMEGLRGETSIAELCRREGLHPNLYYPQGTANGARSLSKQANNGWREIFIAKQTAVR